jgi:hypothetical protein
VTIQSGQPLLLRPATVAIHDDGHVPKSRWQMRFCAHKDLPYHERAQPSNKKPVPGRVW